MSCMLCTIRRCLLPPRAFDTTMFLFRSVDSHMLRRDFGVSTSNLEFGTCRYHKFSSKGMVSRPLFAYIPYPRRRTSKCAPARVVSASQGCRKPTENPHCYSGDWWINSKFVRRLGPRVTETRLGIYMLRILLGALKTYVGASIVVTAREHNVIALDVM
jgi:hypothetical protein